jgi:hypothetical protein
MRVKDYIYFIPHVIFVGVGFYTFIEYKAFGSLVFFGITVVLAMVLAGKFYNSHFKDSVTSVPIEDIENNWIYMLYIATFSVFILFALFYLVEGGHAVRIEKAQRLIYDYNPNAFYVKTTNEYIEVSYSSWFILMTLGELLKLLFPSMFMVNMVLYLQEGHPKWYDSL